MMPRRVGAEGWRAQNFALFSLSLHNFHSFFFSWGSFRPILVVFEAPGTLKCARLEFSRCRVKPPRPKSKNISPNQKKTKKHQKKNKNQKKTSPLYHPKKKTPLPPLRTKNQKNKKINNKIKKMKKMLKERKSNQIIAQKRTNKQKK